MCQVLASLSNFTKFAVGPASRSADLFFQQFLFIRCRGHSGTENEFDLVSDVVIGEL